MKLFSPFDLLILAFVVFSAFFPVFIENLSEKSDNFVVFANNQKIKIPITADTVLSLNNTEIHIKNGTAKIIESDCPHQICVLQKPLSENGQIVCVPNQVIVSLNKKQRQKVDVYAY